MKYRLLKKIERESIPIGDIFTGGTVLISIIDSVVPEIPNGFVKASLLCDLGYIEPIVPVSNCSIERLEGVPSVQMGPSKILDEGERLPFVIGQPFVLSGHGYLHVKYMVVESIRIEEDADHFVLNDQFNSKECRKPTFEELRKYYAPSFWR